VIEADHVVPAAPEELFEFLSDLENHWLLADRFIDVLQLDRSAPDGPAHGARVRMRGPLGLSRVAVTRVGEIEPPRRMAGTARMGGTVAHVSWTFRPEGEDTRVHLAARITEASMPDRLLLAAGGTAWLETRFAAILRVLGRRWAKTPAGAVQQ
jgi:uncharacterized protein YndB with AHSA1/START domain